MNTHLPEEFLCHASRTIKEQQLQQQQQPSKLKTFQMSTMLSSSEMIYLLDMIQGCPSLQNITVPLLSRSWDRILQGRLASTLRCGRNRFQSVHLHFLSVPATSTSIYNAKNNATTTTKKSGRVEQERRQVWNIWKDYLASPITATALREVTVSNLTEFELMELMDILQQQATIVSRDSHWKKIRILNDGVFLSTTVRVINRLSALQTFMPTLQVRLEGTLFLGEEFACNRAIVSQLVTAIANNYLVTDLVLKTNQYSRASNANLFSVKGKDGSRVLPEAATVKAVLDLNRAGRRYMLQDFSNLRAGLVVLGKVIHNLDALFQHLQENPSLCALHRFGSLGPHCRYTIPSASISLHSTCDGCSARTNTGVDTSQNVALCRCCA